MSAELTGAEMVAMALIASRFNAETGEIYHLWKVLCQKLQEDRVQAAKETKRKPTRNETRR
jgi:hypothetical protein